MEQRPLLAAETAEAREARHAAQKAQRRDEAAAAPARVVSADRRQLELRPLDLDSLVPLTHRVRAVWAVVERLDLRAFYARIKARGSWAGRDATDPKVLLALWLYATTEGVGSARELERLCTAHAAYRWLRGGVPLNYHTLSTFRTAHGAALDALLTQVLAVMMKQGLVRLHRVAQDGTRVRAAAGDGTFRRRARLEDYRQQAATQLAALRPQLAAPASALRSARQQAAQQRAARERQQRVEQALTELAVVEQERTQYKPGAKEPPGAARASTTDPEARTMRMGDSGRRPAYNVQFATDTESEVIVGVEVSQRRTDFGEAVPMVEQITERGQAQPQDYLIDAGYTSVANVEALAAKGLAVYGALPVRTGKPDPYAARPTDTAALRALKERMSSLAGQEIYRARSRVSERVHADLKRWRTLAQMVVRGKAKVRCVVLLNVLAYNLLRWLALAPNGGN